jgi:hypothetical protein
VRVLDRSPGWRALVCTASSAKGQKAQDLDRQFEGVCVAVRCARRSRAGWIRLALLSYGGRRSGEVAALTPGGLFPVTGSEDEILGTFRRIRD